MIGHLAAPNGLMVVLTGGVSTSTASKDESTYDADAESQQGVMLRQVEEERSMLEWLLVVAVPLSPVAFGDQSMPKSRDHLGALCSAGRLRVLALRGADSPLGGPGRYVWLNAAHGLGQALFATELFWGQLVWWAEVGALSPPSSLLAVIAGVALAWSEE